MTAHHDEGCFAISVVASQLNLHPQTIRYYERLGLIAPSRTAGRRRLFSRRDVERLERIHSFTTLGVNLAGVEIIVKLLERMDAVQTEAETRMQRMRREMETLQQRLFGESG